MSRRPVPRADHGPLVTVLMPCRNPHVGFLREALHSVFAQTSPRWELLVVDDGSDDPGTLGVLDELASRQDRRMKVVESEGRLVSAALNTGLRQAGTDFVCILHADDLLAPRAIETLGRWMSERPDVDYFYSSRIVIDEEGRPLSGLLRALSFSSLAVFERFCPVKHLHCFRVDRALAIGGIDETLGLHGADDFDFPWSMAETGCVFAAIPDCLYYYRDHREHYRLTTHVPLDAQVTELARILRKHGLPEARVQAQIEARKRDYLQQALYQDEEDRLAKDRDSFDIRTGWREPYE